MRAAGYRAVLFDKDNTLTHPYSPTVHEPLQSALLHCLHIFSPARVAILSNTWGTRDDPLGTASMSVNEVAIPIIRQDARVGGARKPLGGQRIVQHFGVAPAQIVVVGDRLTTDILMGNRLGMLTIHTRPLTEQNDNVNALWIRRWENWILDRLLPQPHSRPDLQARFIRKAPYHDPA